MQQHRLQVGVAPGCKHQQQPPASAATADRSNTSRPHAETTPSCRQQQRHQAAAVQQQVACRSSARLLTAAASQVAAGRLHVSSSRMHVDAAPGCSSSISNILQDRQQRTAAAAVHYMHKRRPVASSSRTTGCEQAAASCMQKQRRAVGGSRSNRLQADRLHSAAAGLMQISVSCKRQQQHKVQTAAAYCSSSSRQACRGSDRLQPVASTTGCKQQLQTACRTAPGRKQRQLHRLQQACCI